jgi:DNA-binding protein HU-beta
MNKMELIETLADKADLSKATASRVLNAFLESVGQAVAKGEDVTLVGFGTFKLATRAARAGRNPRTGAAIEIAATKVPRFTAGLAFKAAVNKKKR